MNPCPAFVAGLLLALAACHPAGEDGLTLHYNRPAQYFEEAFPLGNGRLGAMVYGRTDVERISLNDITLWTGEPDRGSGHPDYARISTLTPWGEAPAWVDSVRAALDAGDYARADVLQRRLQGHYSETYQPLGTLYLRFPKAEVTDYERHLDLSTATAQVSCRRGGKAFRASYFVSAPDSAIVIRLCGEEPIDATLYLESLLPHETKTQEGQLLSDGYAAWHAYPGYAGVPEQFLYDPERGIHYRTVVRCDEAIPAGDSLRICGVKEATIVVASQTSFAGFDKDPVLEGLPYREAALRQAENAARRPWKQLLRRHLKDYQALFNRVSLHLGTTDPAVSALPTDEQLLRYSEGEANPELEALYFQYGRYLLIASSRTPGVPANLQGLWNEHLDPPWSSNYTTNINLEENYWAAEAAGLPELHRVLLDFLHHASVSGNRSAKAYYGVERGWCLAHNSDIWAMSCPVGLGTGDPSWANWNLGAAWLSTHIWEHWLHTRSREQLEADYPVLKGAAAFCIDWMVQRDGKWITSPSTSPENLFITPEGYVGRTAYGGTADMAIIRECLTDALQAAELLEDKAFAQEIRSVLPELLPYRTGADGSLQEWYYDWADADPRHRHQSHLIGVYPGHQAEPGTPLADAAHKALEIKGFETTGWSCGWRVNLYARLGDGESAYRMYRRLLRYVSPDRYDGPDARRGGGTYPNLLDAHSPFQIDGNFGGCAGVLEMLLQSTPEGVTPLPALPAAWPDGFVRGVRTRTGQTADLRWENGRVTELKLY